MQGIPIRHDALAAAGHWSPFFDPHVISPAAQRRLAGNSFQQGCMQAFLSFALASLKARTEVSQQEQEDIQLRSRGMQKSPSKRGLIQAMEVDPDTGSEAELDSEDRMDQMPDAADAEAL